MYSLKYSPFKRIWLIINNETKLAQSSWLSLMQARQVLKGLNNVK